MYRAISDHYAVQNAIIKNESYLGGGLNKSHAMQIIERTAHLQIFILIALMSLPAVVTSKNGRVGANQRVPTRHSIQVLNTESVIEFSI